MSIKAMVVAVALMGSANALAEQSYGRGSVYATNVSAASGHESTVTLVRSGRDSVYIGTMPAPRHRVIGQIPDKSGRS